MMGAQTTSHGVERFSRRPGTAAASIAVLCTLGVLFAAGCTSGTDTGLERLKHEADPRAVEQVLAGHRDTASAAWWGFDEQDSTAALQAAIRSEAKKLIIPNLGKPWVMEPLFLESNQEVVFEEGAVIMALKGAFRGKGDSLLTARDKENITLTGPGASLVMRKPDYQAPPYEKAEWRHCLSLHGCRNIKVYGLRMAASGGDGVYVGRGTGVLPIWKRLSIEHRPAQPVDQLQSVCIRTVQDEAG